MSQKSVPTPALPHRPTFGLRKPDRQAEIIGKFQRRENTSRGEHFGLSRTPTIPAMEAIVPNNLVAEGKKTEKKAQTTITPGNGFRRDE